MKMKSKAASVGGLFRISIRFFEWKLQGIASPTAPGGPGMIPVREHKRPDGTGGIGRGLLWPRFHGLY
jgi:hypothetical protein